MNFIPRFRRILPLCILLGGLIVLALALNLSQTASAQDETPQGSPLHPTFPLLDADGVNVLQSGKPVSTLQTCGNCHDAPFIEQNSNHVQPSSLTRWNPITYSTLTAAAPAWVEKFGFRHVGGGEQGLTEMNCFLCHTAAPNNQDRLAALEAGQFEWANTATLDGTGIVEKIGDGWRWNPAAFTPEGELLEQYITVQDPRSENCGQCHGEVQTDPQVPLTVNACDTKQWNTLTTGQIISPERIANSGINLEGKDDLTRSWDVHAERVVNCVDCHYSANNPVYTTKPTADSPDHLIFDPRRLDNGEYLQRPLHQFASTSADEQPCQACHNPNETHEWLPYRDRHTEALACESCHVPKIYGAALQSVNWTVLKPDGSPQLECRGVSGIGDGTEPPLINGFTPVLLPHKTEDGDSLLSPYNLITAFYWVYGEPAQPVPLDDLKAAWLEGETYAPEVMTAFDGNQNGELEADELLLDSETKQAVIAARLTAQGLTNPHIRGEVEPYAIHHNVTHGEWATRDCQTCHSDDSRINNPMLLTSSAPDGVTPSFSSNGNVTFNGKFISKDEGGLYYQPDSSAGSAGLYILGHDSVYWIDWLGILILLATLIGVVIHGGLRYRAVRRGIPQQPELHKVYMYSVYERQWHWLQTIVIFILIFTGLIIHKPDQFGMFSFRYVVQIHNVMAAILVINAALAAFYHLASGEIRQFLPRPYGFFDDAFAQAKFYLHGIFKGEAHPFEKTPERKMNPLQQMTYLILLNVLLPLQVITGALMWGAQRWTTLAERLGGLPFLAPAHTLIAWLLVSFVVGHVYLTTTGHAPFAGIKSMMLGWDEVEAHPASGTQKESML